MTSAGAANEDPSLARARMQSGAYSPMRRAFLVARCRAGRDILRSYPLRLSEGSSRMRIRTRWSSTALALAVISMGSACADDTPATTINFGDGTSTTASEPTASITWADSTATEGLGTGSGTGTAGETETETTATTGEVVGPGQSASQLVTAGDRSTSRSSWNSNNYVNTAVLVTAS